MSNRIRSSRDNGRLICYRFDRLISANVADVLSMMSIQSSVVPVVGGNIMICNIIDDPIRV